MVVCLVVGWVVSLAWKSAVSSASPTVEKMVVLWAGKKAEKLVWSLVVNWVVSWAECLVLRSVGNLDGRKAAK